MPNSSIARQKIVCSAQTLKDTESSSLSSPSNSMATLLSFLFMSALHGIRNHGRAGRKLSGHHGTWLLLALRLQACWCLLLFGFMAWLSSKGIICVGPVSCPTPQRCKKRARLQGRHSCTFKFRGCTLGCRPEGPVQPGIGKYT